MTQPDDYSSVVGTLLLDRERGIRLSNARTRAASARESWELRAAFDAAERDPRLEPFGRPTTAPKFNHVDEEHRTASEHGTPAPITFIIMNGGDHVRADTPGGRTIRISKAIPTPESRPAFHVPGSAGELNGFEPTREQAAARRALELAVTVDAAGDVQWSGDPLRVIMDVYGYRCNANVPPIPLGTGPARWLAAAVCATDHLYRMDDEPERVMDLLDRALGIARKLAHYAGVDYVRVIQSRETRAARLASLRSSSHSAVVGSRVA